MSQLLGLVQNGFSYDVGKMSLTERNLVINLIKKQAEEINNDLSE